LYPPGFPLRPSLPSQLTAEAFLVPSYHFVRVLIAGKWVFELLRDLQKMIECSVDAVESSMLDVHQASASWKEELAHRAPLAEPWHRNASALKQHRGPLCKVNWRH
jgi:hypothetical protein